MPFLSYITHKQTSFTGNHEQRKEHDALWSPCRKKLPVHSGEKASAVAFGSMTMEAALVLPLFFLAMLALVYRLEIVTIETNIKAGLRSAGKELAKEAAVLPVISPEAFAADIVQAVGAERLDRSIVAGGSAGLDCSKSWMNLKDGKLHLSAIYEIRLPFTVFAIPSWKQEEKTIVKAWTGYDKDAFGGSQMEKLVYITETGVVYHLNPHCRYLELSVRVVPSNTVDALRNAGGSKYVP